MRLLGEGEGSEIDEVGKERWRGRVDSGAKRVKVEDRDISMYQLRSRRGYEHRNELLAFESTD